MKKQILLAFIVTVSCILVSLFLYNFLSPIKSIERMTSIQFPRGISQIDGYDNLEYFIMAHIKLPDQEILPFIKNNNFSSDLPEEYQGFYFTPSTIELGNLRFQVQQFEPENQELPINAELYFLYGKTDFNCWTYVLDKISGRVWVVAFYPDRSGNVSCR